eukprot:Lithocolla_globosa_v1_NODE_5159_length_1291_cov_5.279126.p1 type:complete len:355 gc:universal NODE_5159_length_1291_cov_5.279126:203-1267(+)
MTFMMLLVPIIRYITILQGERYDVEVDSIVCYRYSLFLIFNVFLVSTLAGSIFTQAAELIADPTSIVEMLSSSIPAQGNFFLQYVSIASTGVVASLWRVVDWILYKVMLKYVAKTKDDTNKLTKFRRPLLYVRYAMDMLIFQISFTYSVMYPLILLFSTIYFASSYLTYKYNLVFVYHNCVDGDGHLTMFSVRLIHWSLGIAQLTMFGVFTLNLFGGAFLILLLFFVHLIWVYVGITSRLYPSINNTPLELLGGWTATLPTHPESIQSASSTALPSSSSPHSSKEQPLLAGGTSADSYNLYIGEDLRDALLAPVSEVSLESIPTDSPFYDNLKDYIQPGMAEIVSKFQKVEPIP